VTWVADYLNGLEGRVSANVRSYDARQAVISVRSTRICRMDH